MKASELIKDLRQMIDDEGDLEVVNEDGDSIIIVTNEFGGDDEDTIVFEVTV